MKIAAYIRHNDSSTNDRVHHFAKALGAEITYRENPVECDLAIQSGLKPSPALNDAVARGIPFIILENPVWDQEEGTYAWSYNGLAGLGTIPDPSECVARYHPPLQAWKDWEEGQTTIFGQVENDKALRGADIHEWVAGCQRVLPEAVFRPHPIMLGRKEKEEQEDFGEALARTSLSVTYSSTTGSQAVIAGISNIACHKGNLAWEVSSHSLSDAPRAPNRREWIHKLSYRHINDIVPVDYILGGYDEARADSEAGKYDYVQ